MTKKQKLSDEIFDKLMEKEDKIMDKTYDLMRILLSQKNFTSNNFAKNDIHIKAHEIDDLLFERHELSCSYSTVSDMEKNKK